MPVRALFALRRGIYNRGVVRAEIPLGALFAKRNAVLHIAIRAQRAGEVANSSS